MAKTLPKTEAVVVGMGWTGSILAAELGKEGVEVVALERGRGRDLQDYYVVHDELRYGIRYELMQDLSKETISFRNHARETALPMRQLGSFLLGEGMGGSGVHWNGQTYRFLPYDFEIRSKTIEKYGEGKIKGLQLQDWGITYDELEPYFYEFEKAAGISGEENPLGGNRANAYPTPPMKETPVTARFKEAAQSLNYHPYHMPSGNLSQGYENQYGANLAACQYCGFCERFGCEYGAKSDPTVAVIPFIKEQDNVDLRNFCNVTEVLHDGTKATGVKYVDVRTKEEFIQPADMVVLTSYVMNNARLLLTSNLGRPYDPETGRGVIGKNYCYQILPGSVGFFEEEQFNTFMGAGALGATLDDFNGDNFDHSDLDFIHGGTIAINQSGNRPIQVNNVPNDTPSWGAQFKDDSVKYFTRSLSITSQGASMPTSYNYLDLDPTYKDAYGLPLLRMTYDYSDQDRNLFNYIGKVTDEIMQEMGASHINERDNLEHYDIVPYQTTHNTGGVIMGSDPETSAVNNYFQMWEAENVFVVGASAFAHNGGYNPTGTVGAFAYRAAEGMLKYREEGGSLV
ncbi:GMC family oxidoreductase [Shouchella shacheensis]|uniref:GMC family oxidoreductase n=1 Tax=Shouchella shacheensis TaxID=1649580 RepID=UPI00073FE11F|nr:GMC family oxidoreductase [Shouchella shacheensis]